MILVKDNYKNIKNQEPLTITIGNFDGVHLAHQTLIKKLKGYKDTKSGLITFDPHPLKLFKIPNYQKLMNLDDKIKVISEFNLNYMFIVEFNEGFSKLSVNEFIDFLKKLNVKRVIIGSDFRFGYKKLGTIKDLKEHFEVIVIKDLLTNDELISTTHVKELIYNAKLEEAKKLMTRNYFITSTVMKGSNIGSKLGFPTANLDYNDYLVPKDGVYYANVVYDGKLYKGALNIGHNPTLNYSDKKRVEVHLLDFNGELYGKVLTVYFIKYLREELKFKSKDELINTLKNDVLKISREPFLENIKII
ncbi:MAG: bifunctional riboflavin kinase/FAD synthetase [Acholeplasmatales bacterium]